MLQLLFCLFGLHGATEVEYPISDKETNVCRDCLKEVKKTLKRRSVILEFNEKRIVFRFSYFPRDQSCVDSK